MNWRSLGRNPQLVLAVLATAGLLWFGVFPIGLLVIKAFQVGDGFGLANFVLMYSNPTNLSAIATTVAASLLTMVASLAISLPLAWLVARTDFPGKQFLRTLSVAPYMVPPFVGAIAWTYLANPRVGYFNRLLNGWLGGEAWTVNIYGIAGLVLVQAAFYFPLAFIAIANGMERADPSIEEAAQISGAGKWRTFRDVTMPLLAPSIIGGGLLVFGAVAATFGVPAIIGLPEGVEVVTTRIVRAVYVGTPDALRQATALAVALMALGVAALALSNSYLSRRQYTTVTGGARRLEPTALGRWSWPLGILAFGMIFVLAILPLGSLLMTSFVHSMGEDIGANNWTLARWQAVLSGAKTWDTLRMSFLLAVTAATLGVVMGHVISHLKVRTRFLGRNIPDFLVTFTYGSPGIVVALGMIIAFSGAFGLNLYGTFMILLVAYMARMLAYSVRTISAAMEQVHPSIEEAAISCGASWLRATRDVTIPLLGPALIGSWFLVFIRALYELTMSVLLYSTATMTVGVYLYDLESYADPQSSAVLSSLLLVLVLGGSLAMRWATRGRFAL